MKLWTLCRNVFAWIRSTPARAWRAFCRVVAAVWTLALAGAVAVSILFAIASLIYVSAIIAPETTRNVMKFFGKPGETLANLIPPALPRQDIRETQWLQQGWSPAERDQFHTTSQGTATFPVPYDWFAALEQPDLGFFASRGMLADPMYLSRLGFIPRPADAPANRAQIAGDQPLPVGLSILPRGTDPTTGAAYPAMIGLTCAACHTGSLQYKGKRIGIDGGSAIVDLNKLESVIGLSVLYTRWLPFRANAFAERLLERELKRTPNASITSRMRADRIAEIKKQLAGLSEKMVLAIRTNAAIHAHHGVQSKSEGPGRLDALTRIGNQVFFENLVRPEELSGFDIARDPRARNLQPISAPVSFPHVWNVPWFLWAQYDASIFNESIRNVGEALGVRAKINMTNPGGGLFRSSVRVADINWLEEMLSGKDKRTNMLDGEKTFAGLRSPEWDDLRKLAPGDTALDVAQALIDKGREDYRKHCFECHRGPVHDPKFDSAYKGLSLWDKENPEPGGKKPHKNWIEVGGRPYFAPVQKPVADMGTDPGQANILATRTVYLPPWLGLKPLLELSRSCSERVRRPSRLPQPLSEDEARQHCGIPGEDSAYSPYSLALMAVVARTESAWFAQDADPGSTSAEELQKRIDAIQGVRENMPNMLTNQLRVVNGEKSLLAVPHYRARPLNGVWATAPFLHNGSVLSLEQLLTPQNERIAKFCVGLPQFDPDAVGIAFIKPLDSKSCPGGSVLFDANVPGNSNRGHSFEGPAIIEPGVYPRGVIGPALDNDTRKAIIAYVKTMKGAPPLQGSAR